MSERVAQKPMPSVGQVWKFADEAPSVIASTDDNETYFDSGACPLTVYLKNDPRWSCIGISTTAGRVMVGERRRGEVTGEPFAVASVHGTQVVMEQAPGGGRVYLEASAVARWPLISPPTPAAVAPKAEDPDAYKRPPGCLCTWEEGDSACPVHPTCPGCGCVTCECPTLRPALARAARTPIVSPPPLVPGFRALCKCGAPMPAWYDMCQGCAYERAIADCNRAILTTICGPSADPREQGPGIAARVPPRPSVRPDVVATEVWERWSLP